MPLHRFHVHSSVAKHNSFRFKEAALKHSGAAAERNLSAGVDNSVPWDLGTGRDVVQCVSCQPRLSGQSADSRNGSVRNYTTARDFCDRFPDFCIGMNGGFPLRHVDSFE
jgi:hypothetical protein